MILLVHSDAFYLSSPRTGSITGSVYTSPSTINHPVSTRIPVVASLVTEAENVVVFAAACIALDERQVRADLGHSQPPTVICCDNECVIGLADRGHDAEVRQVPGNSFPLDP